MGTRQRQRLGHIGPESYPEGTYLPPLENLRGATVIDANGDRVGTVDEIFVDHTGRFVRYIGVATGWLGMRRHVIPIDDVSMGAVADELMVPYDKDLLRKGPAFEPGEDLTAARERDVYRHYARPGYWEAIRARQETPAATPEIARSEGESGERLTARQTEPAPTQEIAEAEAEDALSRGEDPTRVRVRRWGV